MTRNTKIVIGVVGALGGACVLGLCGAIGGVVLGAKDVTRKPPPAPQPPAKVVAATPVDAGTEIDRPGSKEFLGVLKSVGLWGATVTDFAHLEGYAPDRLTITVADDYRDAEKAERRKVGRALWTLWSQANLKHQPDREKSTIVIWDRFGRQLAKSAKSGSDIELSDD